MCLLLFIVLSSVTCSLLCSLWSHMLTLWFLYSLCYLLLPAHPHCGLLVHNVPSSIHRALFCYMFPLMLTVVSYAHFVVPLFIVLSSAPCPPSLWSLML